MDCLGAGVQVVNYKGITSIAVNIILSSSTEIIENRTSKMLQTLTAFSKEHCRHNKQDKKLLRECHMSRKRKSYWEIFMCQRKEKLLTKCHASNIYIYIYIYIQKMCVCVCKYVLIKKRSHKRYATVTTLVEVWILWSFKIFLWSVLYWWVLKERNSCCLQTDLIYKHNHEIKKKF